MKTKFKNFSENFGSGDYASYDNDSGDVFWGNMGAGALIFSKSSKRFLLNLRSKYVNEPGEFSIWGGKIDSNENIENAIKREFFEESGYDDEINLVPLYIFNSPGSTFIYYNYLGIIKDEFIPKLDWESDGYKWVSYDELFKIKPIHFGLKNILEDVDSLKTIQSFL